jgi:transposase
MEAFLVSLSTPELRRLAVLERVLAGDLSQVAAAPLLQLSVRQLKRLVASLRRDGPVALASKRRGRPGNRRTNPEVLDRALSLYRQHYADFGPTFAAEKLAQRHDLKIDHETLRRALIASGDHRARRRNERKPHLPRDRRAARGELVQLDGSPHAWFEDRAPKCTLLVAIDDATSELMALRFEPAETTLGYFALLNDYLRNTGRPLSFYTDKAGIFMKTVETPTREKTQFGRALDELDVELICANSPQAKGRVERVNSTLQDRLVKELRLRSITTIDVANLYLSEYVEEHNRRFARAPRTTFDAHRVLGPEHNLARILALRYRRTIAANGIVSYENRLFAVDYRQLKSLTSRVVEVRVQGGRVFIEQGEAALRFAELPAPVRPARPAVVERADEGVPNPNKAHPPPKNHPWTTPANALARRPKGTSLTSSPGT